MPTRWRTSGGAAAGGDVISPGRKNERRDERCRACDFAAAFGCVRVVFGDEKGDAVEGWAIRGGAGGQFEAARAHDDIFVHDVAGRELEGFYACCLTVVDRDGVGAGGQDEIGVLGLADPDRTRAALGGCGVSGDGYEGGG